MQWKHLFFHYITPIYKPVTADCLLTFLLKWSACPCQYWLFRLATTDFSTSKDGKLMNGASCISHKCTVSTTFSFAMSFLLSSPSATATRIGLHVSWWSIHGRDCSLLLRLSVMTRLTSIRLKHFSHYNRVNPSIENGPLLSPFLPWFSKSLLSHWLGMGQSVLGSLLSNMFFCEIVLVCDFALLMLCLLLFFCLNTAAQ